MTLSCRTICRLAEVLAILVLVTSAMAQNCPPQNPRVAPDSRYLDHADGTVTDQQTGLMWKRCSEGQSGTDCSGTVGVQGWQSALATAANSSFAGHVDWRLPSAKELSSLVESGCYSPAINTTIFPNTSSSWYWTSTTNAFSPSVAWVVGFVDGDTNSVNGKTGPYGVRLVRQGP